MCCPLRNPFSLSAVRSTLTSVKKSGREPMGNRGPILATDRERLEYKAMIVLFVTLFIPVVFVSVISGIGCMVIIGAFSEISV